MKTIFCCLLAFIAIALQAQTPLYSPLPAGEPRILASSSPPGPGILTSIKKSSADEAVLYVYFTDAFEWAQTYKRFKGNIFVSQISGQWELPLRSMFVMRTPTVMEFYRVDRVENTDSRQMEDQVVRVLVFVPVGTKPGDLFRTAWTNARAMDLKALSAELAADGSSLKQKLIEEEKARRAKLEREAAIQDSLDAAKK